MLKCNFSLSGRPLGVQSATYDALAVTLPRCPAPRARTAGATRPQRRTVGALPRVQAVAESEAASLSEEKRDLQQLMSKPYKYGFQTEIESDVFPKGLSEDVVRAISAKKEEPEWMLDFR